MNYRLIFCTLLITCVGLSIVACNDDDVEDLGQVTGAIVAANGETPIPGATITLVGHSEFTTQTSQDGTFSINLPEGLHELSAVRGNFSTTIQDVDVNIGETFELDPEILENDAPIGYVRGSYDSIENIVQGVLGYSATEVPASELATADLDGFGILFLNCGMSYDIENQALLDNLKSYVDNGGILYASDLTLDLIHAAFPDNIVDHSSNTSNGTYEATLVDSDILQWFGGSSAQSTVSVTYDLDDWQAIKEITDAPTVLIENNTPDSEGEPLAIRIQPSATSGAVVYTTFHNSQQLTEDQNTLLNYFIFAE